MDAELLTQVETAEERLRLAMLLSDTRALDELLADDLHFTDHFGHVNSKADDLAFHRSGALRLVDLSPSEQHIQPLPGGAVVSVLMHLLGSYQGQPINQHIRYSRVWAAGPEGALRVIVGHASELRPAGAPVAQLGGGIGLRVTGRVVWAAVPVPGARLELRTGPNYFNQPALAETVSGADGWFVLDNPPAGKFMLFAEPPSEVYAGGIGHPITIGAGQAVRTHNFELAKKMELIAPEVGATLATTSPMLRWESYPEAAHYHVDIFNNDTGEAVMRADTPDTSLVVTPPLASGLYYQWSVHAANFANQRLAYSVSSVFRVEV